MSRFGLRIQYTLAWESDWHVGSGFGSIAVDRLVCRRGGREVPYVPGSQVKGVLRQMCEQLVATLGGPVVDTHGADQDANEELVRTFQPVAESPLLVDRLFGSRYSGECLFCSNAEPSSSPKRELPVTMRNSIDRATGTAAAQKLFSTEVVPADWYQLTGEVEGHHPARQLTASMSGFPYEYSLLVAATRLLDALGGDRSVGRGSVVAEVNTIRWKSPEQTGWADLDIDMAIQPLSEDDELIALVDLTRDEQC